MCQQFVFGVGGLVRVEDGIVSFYCTYRWRYSSSKHGSDPDLTCVIYGRIGTPGIRIRNSRSPAADEDHVIYRLKCGG